MVAYGLSYPYAVLSAYEIPDMAEPLGGPPARRLKTAEDNRLHPNFSQQVGFSATTGFVSILKTPRFTCIGPTHVRHTGGRIFQPFTRRKNGRTRSGISR
jgi:hypothetical protein